MSITRKQKQTIRLAALLHDIGHGPFSHTFEELLDRNETYVTRFNGKCFHSHEDFSEHILRNNWELKNALGAYRSQIVNFLFGDKPIGFVPSEIVIGDIGSDRIDYLLRDTYYTGLGHRADVHSLISHMRISVKEARHPRLALKAEGVLPAELLITTRYYHYFMIVHNPRTRSVELLFLRLMENFLKQHKDPRGYLFKAFTEHDDSIILHDLFNFGGSLRHLFFAGKSFHPTYSISLGQLRSGVTKYCLYRFFFDRKGLMTYVRQIGGKLKKELARDDVHFDVHLFNHKVPDIILHAERYETEKEWISPLLVDQSNILRSIPLEQLLRSLVCVMSKPGLSNKEREKIHRNVERKRGIFLARDVLVPLTRESLNLNGFRLVDQFYTFLCALRDFYKQKPWKEDTPSLPKEEVFRGIGRFYSIANKCRKEIGKPDFKFKEFFKGKGKSFPYSTEGFSMLNALASMRMLRMDYLPIWKKQKRKPFHSVYIIRPLEKDIRKRVYEGLVGFNNLRSQFINIFEELDWEKYFEDFFPLKSEG